MGHLGAPQWLPRRANVDARRRLYLNAELVDKETIKRATAALTRAYRVAVVKFYSAKGYRVSERALKNAESHGPLPEFIWINFVDANAAEALLGDTAIPPADDALAEFFVRGFVEYLQSRGWDVKHAAIVELGKMYGHPALRRALLVKFSLTAAKGHSRGFQGSGSI